MWGVDMIGIFWVEEIIGEKKVKASALMNDGIKGIFYLPPLNRTNTSNIKVNTRFIGVLDEVTGYGALCVAIDDDFEGRFDYDLKINGNVKASEDVTAGAISLKSHIHSIEGLVVSAGEPPVPIGTGAGVTDAPVGG